MANVRLATGLADSVTSRGADIARVSGQMVLMFGFWTMAGKSSKTKAPPRLFE